MGAKVSTEVEGEKEDNINGHHFDIIPKFISCKYD